MKAVKLWQICCFFIVLLFCKNVAAELVRVGLSSFGAKTVYESFEEAIDYSNAIDHTNESWTGGIVLPGTHSSYTFSQSGVKLTAPIPNIQNTPGNYFRQIVIYDTKETYGLADYGVFNLEHIPPDGRHFLMEYGSSYILFSPFVLTLPYGAERVGAYWFMYGKNYGYDRLQVDAYGLDNQYLGSVLIPAASVLDRDWSNNYYAFETSDGSLIKSIAINYWGGTGYAAHPGLDLLMFEVPEPSTLALLSIAGLITSAQLLFRKRYK